MIYAVISISCWVSVLVAVAWSKADWRLHTKGGNQNKLAYADFGRVFQKVFWQLVWQISIVRAAIFFLDPSLSELDYHARSFLYSSYRPYSLSMVFFPDLVVLQKVLQPVGISLPDYGTTMLLALLFFCGCFLAALATIVAFLMTLNHGRKRYLQ